MSVDFICAVILTVFIFLGWRSGAFRQGVRLAGAALVVVAGPFVARLLREMAFGEPSPAVPLVEAASLVGAGILIYLTAAFAGWLAIKVMRAASDTLSTMDRAGGAGLGALKGALLVYCIVFAALLIRPALERVDPDDHLRTRDGWATTFVEDYNVLGPWHLPEVDRLHRLVRVVHVAKEKGEERIIRDHADAAAIVADERVRAIIDDEGLVGAAMSDDFVTTLADDEVRGLLKDGDFVEDLDDVDWASMERELGIEVEKRLPGAIEEAMAAEAPKSEGEAQPEAPAESEPAPASDLKK